MTYLPSMESVQGLRDIFLDRVTVPLFNAVGNHDLKNGRTFYQSNFGQTYYSFEYGSLQIIVLDTVISHCYIEGHQLDMLNSVLEDALQNNHIRNIFIFAHKLIFLEDEDLRVGRMGCVSMALISHNYGTIFSSLPLWRNPSIFLPEMWARLVETSLLSIISTPIQISLPLR